MLRRRICIIAGLATMAITMATEASAQNCPAWLAWACPESESSTSGAKESAPLNSTEQRGQTAPPAATTARKPKPATADGAEPASAAKPARSASAGERPRAPAQQTVRQDPRISPAMSEQEKAVLFQQFVEWQKAQGATAAAKQ
jgi:hypothetical protein